MTAGTVVITGGILATVILLCIIAVLCYCRLQVLPTGGEGDRAPEGWGRRPGWSGAWRVTRQREPGSRIECRRIQPDFRGDALQWGWSVSVLLSGQLCGSLKALTEVQRPPRT